MELILRPFRKEDIDALYFLDQRSYPEPYRFSYGQLVSTLLDPRVMAVVLAAEDDPNRPVRLMGALILQQEAVDKRLVILTVMVEPGYRRQGLGKKLLDWAFRVGQINGLEEVWSPVEAANGEAMEFFKAAGFAWDGNPSPFFKDESKGGVWTKKLPPEEASQSSGQTQGLAGEQ